MILNGQVLGKPLVLYKDTQANIEALTGLVAGMEAFATDLLQFGTYDGSSWVWGAGGGGGALDPNLPQSVGTSNTVGTSGSAAHGNHVHQGVHGLYVPGSSLAYGDLTLSGSGNISVSQSSGSFTVSSSGSFYPVAHDINGSQHDGFPLTVAHGGLGTAQAVTSGAIPIGTSGGIYAPNHLVQGANVTITSSSGSITISASSGGHTIQYNTTPQTSRANLNFTGTGVVVSDNADNNSTDVTISSSAGIDDIATLAYAIAFGG